MNQEFPLYTQLGEFKDAAELDEFLLSYPADEIGIDYGYFIKCNYVINHKVVDVIDRFFAHQTFGITSFSNDYDQIPAYILDGYTVIQDQFPLINNYLNKKKNG